MFTLKNRTVCGECKALGYKTRSKGLIIVNLQVANDAAFAKPVILTKIAKVQVLAQKV